MSVAHRYHQSTKYHPDTIGNHPGLDWSRQPEPFKEFRSSARIDMSANVKVIQDELTSRLHLALDEPTDLDRLATLLLHVNGVTARHESPEHTTWFRAAPSAGALYPTEIYVAVRDVDGLADGIWNFQVRGHELAPVCEGDFWGDLSHASFGHAAIDAARIVVLFTAVFFRSSWRYRDRAYRRILLDTGHVMGNLCAIGPELDLHPIVLGAFDDAAVNSLLLLDEENEAMLAIAPLIEGEAGAEAFTAAAATTAAGEPPPSDDLIVRVHRAGYAHAPGVEADPVRPGELVGEKTALEHDPIDWTDRLSETILRRRSTRVLTSGPIPKEELAALLHHACAALRPDSAEGRRTLLAPGVLTTFVVVHRVTGLEPGVYRLDPRTMTLGLIREGRMEQACYQISLGQDLAQDAAAVVIHTADLDAVVTAHGDRGYRYLGLDAGNIGQRLNLAAIRLGLGVSGIAGYFDDLACDLCGLPRERAVVYLTCLGQAPSDL